MKFHAKSFAPYVENERGKILNLTTVLILDFLSTNTYS
jgi:hypothetical protein